MRDQIQLGVASVDVTLEDVRRLTSLCSITGLHAVDKDVLISTFSKCSDLEGRMSKIQFEKVP
jgi:hypothetical protein